MKESIEDIQSIIGKLVYAVPSAMLSDFMFSSTDVPTINFSTLTFNTLHRYFNIFHVSWQINENKIKVSTLSQKDARALDIRLKCSQVICIVTVQSLAE